MKQLFLSFLLLCGTMSFASMPQHHVIAIDDSLQRIVPIEMNYRLKHLSPEWGCASSGGQYQEAVVHSSHGETIPVFGS